MKRFGGMFLMILLLSWSLHAQLETNNSNNANANDVSNNNEVPAVAMQPEEEGVPAVINGTPLVTDLTPGWQENQRPGNYQKKALAFKKAGEIYEQIRKIEPALQKARDSFFSQKSDINKRVAQFYLEIGASQYELSSEIDEVLQELDEEEKEDGELTEEEREIALELNQNKTDLNQLKKNIAALEELSSSLDSALVQLDGQTRKLQNYEDQAWQMYQKIDEIFDDQQANDLVEQMKVLLANAQEMQKYIQGAFAQFYASTANSITSQIGKITTTVEALKNRGVQLAQQVEEIDEEEEARIAAEKAAQEAEEAAKKALEEQTWINRLKNWFSGVWGLIKGSIQGVFDRIMPAAQPETPAPEAGQDAKDTAPMPQEAQQKVAVAQPTKPPAIPVRPALPTVQLPGVPQPKALPQPPG